MAVLSVRKYGDPVLRRQAKPVEAVTPEIKRVIADMVDTMYDEVGLGLAAPQVGISLRLMVVGDDDGREVRALINPLIAEQGGEIVAEEGCLSIPGIFAQVKRAEWVRLEAQDEMGRPVSITARGLRARVLQHEMDHLDGVLILERTSRDERKRALRELREAEREREAA
jgi:peptide deformylase